MGTSEPTTAPVLYLAYGDDHQALSEFAASLIKRLTEAAPDPTLAEMNINRLDGFAPQTDLGAIQNAAYSLPFLSDRRLVLVTNTQGCFSSAGRGAESKGTSPVLDAWVKMLSGLPESTALVLVVEDAYIRGSRGRGWVFMDNSKAGKMLLNWAQEAGSRA
jgi:hypothetical protein